MPAAAPAPQRRGSFADGAVLLFWLGLILLNMLGILAAVALLPTRWWRPALAWILVVGALDLLPLRARPAWLERATYRFCGERGLLFLEGAEGERWREAAHRGDAGVPSLG